MLDSFFADNLYDRKSYVYIHIYINIYEPFHSDSCDKVTHIYNSQLASK